MTDWFRFVFSNKRLLNFGFLFNFFSSFGQTFFISLFVPFWVKELDITNALFGSMYATVTIVSAGLLSISGKYIDRMPLPKYAFIVFSSLMISVILLSQAYHIAVLMLALFLVRWFGQGLMTHTSSTGIAKYFTTNRGKALGFTALGNPAGQFVLPLIIAPLIAYFGWRMGLVYMSVAAIALMIPTLLAIDSVTVAIPKEKNPKDGLSATNINYLRTSTFWIITGNSFILPFICTAVFLYQYTIGQSKAWDSSWVAFSFAFFAIFSAAFLLLSGTLVDKFTGIKLFPIYLVPAMMGLMLISLIDDKWIFPVFYSLLGVSVGLGSTIKTSVQVDVYGTENLGRIRSYFSTLLVLSTAIGPPIFGYFIDKKFSINGIMGITALFVLGVILLSFKIKKNSTNTTNNPNV